MQTQTLTTMVVVPTPSLNIRHGYKPQHEGIIWHVDPRIKLSNSTSTSGTQVIIHYEILKLSPDARNWRAQQRVFVSWWVINLVRTKYLPARIDSEWWKIKYLLQNNSKKSYYKEVHQITQWKSIIKNLQKTPIWFNIT